MAPLVSIIIPTYNRREQVMRALESVACQSYSSIEVIVADDCSTDGTAEALNDCRFRMPVHVVRLASNQGPASARNAAIMRASGKYIALLDSDDRWLPTKLARQVEVAEKSATPESILVYSQTCIRRRYESIVRPLRSLQRKEAIADYLFANGGYIAQTAVMVSTNAARRIMFRAGMRLHEDWDWLIRLQQQGVTLVMVPEVLCEVDDRAAAGRSSNPSPDLSLRALESWRPVISPTAYLAFRAKVAPQMRHSAPVQALRMILNAYLKGAISTWCLVTLVGRLVHPGLREAAYIARGAVAGLRRTDIRGGSVLRRC